MLPLKRRRSTFAPPPTALEHQAVPVITTMIASLAPLFPVVATQPLMPPLGLMVFLGWRLLSGNIWPLWMGLPLGLWDDLFSGQPIGTAMCGWTMVMLVLDQLDRRLPFRSHGEDWVLATTAIGAHLLLALTLAGGATSSVQLLPQIVIAALLFPIIARTCAALDRWRGNR